MVFSRRKLFVAAAATLLVPTFALVRAKGSDHADTPQIAATPGADLTDVYVFPKPGDPSKVVLAMSVHPLIPTGQGPNVSFDPDVLYQFKIDNTGDGVEDLVIQANFTGTGPSQQVNIRGPLVPTMKGNRNQMLGPITATGTINNVFTQGGMQVFAGAREDSFFFDLSRFFQILPDRATPVNGVPVIPSQANVPQKASFRGMPTTEAGAGSPTDFLLGLNVLSIVVELPKSQLIGGGSGNIGIWCTTSK